MKKGEQTWTLEKKHPTCKTCKWFKDPVDCSLFSLVVNADDFYCKDHEAKEEAGDENERTNNKEI